MARADVSNAARDLQLNLLKGYLVHLPIGIAVPIEDWYESMKAIGLEHSDRQRLSDLRKLGLDCRYDKKLKAYHYKGWHVDSYVQQDLPLNL